jgi:Homeodomain-like domain
VALRARIVLLSAEGLSNTEVARRVHVTLATVGKWRQRTLQLENAIRHFIDHHNQNPKPFVWTKSADQILDSVARFCKRTLDSVL